MPMHFGCFFFSIFLSFDDRKTSEIVQNPFFSPIFPVINSILHKTGLNAIWQSTESVSYNNNNNSSYAQRQNTGNMANERSSSSVCKKADWTEKTICHSLDSICLIAEETFELYFLYFFLLVCFHISASYVFVWGIEDIRSSIFFEYLESDEIEMHSIRQTILNAFPYFFRSIEINRWAYLNLLKRFQWFSIQSNQYIH